MSGFPETHGSLIEQAKEIAVESAVAQTRGVSVPTSFNPVAIRSPRIGVMIKEIRNSRY